MLDDVEESNGRQRAVPETRTIKRCADDGVESATDGVPCAIETRFDEYGLESGLAKTRRNEAVPSADIEDSSARRKPTHDLGDDLVPVCEPERVVLDGKTLVVTLRRVTDRRRRSRDPESRTGLAQIVGNVFDPDAHDGCAFIGLGIRHETQLNGTHRDKRCTVPPWPDSPGQRSARGYHIALAPAGRPG